MKRPRQRREGLSPVERAQLKAYMAKDVRETFTAAQIHAMVGDDSAEMVNKAGRMFYTVLGAAIADNLDPEMPELRILRGACNAMYEQAGEEVIASERRASMNAGLQACERLLEVLDYDCVVNAALELHVLLMRKHVDWNDFRQMLERVEA